MDQSHINIFDLHEWLKALDEKHLLRKLMQYGMLPMEGKYLCKSCQQPLTLRIDNSVIDHYRWCCDNYVSRRKQRRIRCNFKTSIRKGTFFEKSHLRIEVILKFIHFWIYNTPLNIIQFNLKISSRTAVDFANFCREVVYDQMIINSKPIGGPGVHVEIDESKFGPRPQSRRSMGFWWFRTRYR